MNVAIPSSRSPKALRGDTLHDALRDLGGSDSEPIPPPESMERTLRSALPQSVERAVDDAEDDEPAPTALRPDQLARWLERNA